MRSYLIVVFHVRQQYVTKMPFAQHDDMIELPNASRDQAHKILREPEFEKKRLKAGNQSCR
jgi:hypothetical protein